MTYRTRLILAFLLTFSPSVAPRVLAASPDDPKDAPAAAAPASAAQASDDDAALDPIEPDYVVVNLPTTLRLPVRAWNFHLTHRFTGVNLRQDSFSDQASNLFGIDTGANIGFELRYGVFRHLEAIVQRTTISKTFQFSGKYDGWHQGPNRVVSVSALASIEGDDNFQESYAPALGAVVSREIGTRAAVYATPMWVHNSGGLVAPDRDTGFLGLAARVAILPTLYVVGEAAPRIGGYAIGDPEYGFGIEKRVGAHVFSLTFTNGAATTNRQIANGGVPEALYFGFNLTRKFF